MSVLNVQQAMTILETLSLLKTKQHEKSKLIMHSTSIELESDSSTWRTASAVTETVSSNFRWFAGLKTEKTSRELAELPPLMRNVYQALADQDFHPANAESSKTRLDLAQNASDGLSSLIENEYKEDSVKRGLIEEAKGSVAEIITYFKQFTNISSGAGQGNQQQRLIAAKDLQIADLRQQNATLTLRVQDKQASIDLLERTLEENKKEISRLKALVVNESLSDPANIDKVPSHVLIERIHVQTGILVARQAKT
jgi:hypothetical protein